MFFFIIFIVVLYIRPLKVFSVVVVVIYVVALAVDVLDIVVVAIAVRVMPVSLRIIFGFELVSALMQSSLCKPKQTKKNLQSRLIENTDNMSFLHWKIVTD